MVKRTLCICAALAALSAASLQAASWSLVGTSGFTSTNNPGGNTGLADNSRIKLHGIVVDSLGDVYITAGTNGSNTGTAAADRAGVTVFPAGGGAPVDIDITPFPGDVNYPAGLNIPGGITKMVVGGDGRVYALQGYIEIQFGGAIGGWKQKVLRFRRDPGNPGAYLTEQIFNFDTERLALGFTIAESNPDRDVIGGMTVGADGNIYWTCGQNLSNIWKFRFLYRYNTATNTLERSPLNCGINTDTTAPNCTVAQGGTNERMFNIESVGTDSTLTGPFKNWFAIISQGAIGGAGQSWNLEGMTWDTGRQAVSLNGKADATIGPWWRDFVTQTAYDPIRKKLWVAGRSRNPNSGTNNSGRAWESAGTASNTNNPTLDGAATVLKVVKTNATNREWRRRLALGQTAVTLGARFKVEAYSNDFLGSLMHISARTPDATPATPQIALAIRSDRFKVLDAVNSYAELADLGPVTTTDYYEVHMYCDTTGAAKVWLDGTLSTITGAALRATNTATDTIGFGVGSSKSQASTGTATVLFDWIGMSNTEVPGQAKPEPTNIWPSQSLAAGGILGAFLDGSFQPQDFGISNIIVRFNGDPANEALYLNSPISIASLPTAPTAWAANGNNPGLLDGGTQIGGDGIASSLASNIPNGGNYWVSALAINPCDGTAWMAWGGAEMYETNLSNLPPGDTTPRLQNKYSYNGTYGPTGKVYTVGANGTIYTAGGDEGSPLAPWTSTVVGITFKGKKVYTLVQDRSTNPATYKVYVATNPSPACCSEVPFDSDDDGDVDMNDFGAFQACYGNTTAFQYSAANCACFDRAPGALSPNGLINDADFTKFMNCATRSNITQSNLNCD